jgi:HlyD family secretion protein
MMAQAKGKIAEIELQIIQIDQDLRSEVGKDLIETRSKLSELPNARSRRWICSIAPGRPCS